MGGLGENFLVDYDQDEQDENSDDGAGYEALLVHPIKIWYQSEDEQGVR